MKGQKLIVLFWLLTAIVSLKAQPYWAFRDYKSNDNTVGANVVKISATSFVYLTHNFEKNQFTVYLSDNYGNTLKKRIFVCGPTNIEPPRLIFHSGYLYGAYSLLTDPRGLQQRAFGALFKMDTCLNMLKYRVLAFHDPKDSFGSATFGYMSKGIYVSAENKFYTAIKNMPPKSRGLAFIEFDTGLNVKPNYLFPADDISFGKIIGGVISYGGQFYYDYKNTTYLKPFYSKLNLKTGENALFGFELTDTMFFGRLIHKFNKDSSLFYGSFIKAQPNGWDSIHHAYFHGTIRTNLLNAEITQVGDTTSPNWAFHVLEDTPKNRCSVVEHGFVYNQPYRGYTNMIKYDQNWRPEGFRALMGKGNRTPIIDNYNTSDVIDYAVLESNKIFLSGIIEWPVGGGSNWDIFYIGVDTNFNVLLKYTDTNTMACGSKYTESTVTPPAHDTVTFEVTDFKFTNTTIHDVKIDKYTSLRNNYVNTRPPAVNHNKALRTAQTAQGWLVTLTLPLAASYRISLQNIEGRTLYMANFTGNTYDVNALGFAAGIYIIRVENATDVYEAKVIKSE